jgi:hypothetical protein
MRMKSKFIFPMTIMLLAGSLSWGKTASPERKADRQVKEISSVRGVLVSMDCARGILVITSDGRYIRFRLSADVCRSDPLKAGADVIVDYTRFSDGVLMADRLTPAR